MSFAPPFYVNWKGSRQGPFGVEEIRKLLKTGEISPLASIVCGQRNLTIPEFLERSTQTGSDANSENHEVTQLTSTSPLSSTNQMPPDEPYIHTRNLQKEQALSSSVLPLLIFGIIMALLSAFFLPILSGVAALGAGIALLTQKARLQGSCVILLVTLCVLIAQIRISDTEKVAVVQEPQVSTQPMELPELRKFTKPAVVQVIALDANHAPIGSGSGFFIDPHSVVTNFHVVDGSRSIVFILDNKSESRCVRVLHLDKTRDIAILESELAGPAHLGIENVVEEGERIAVIGSPMGFDGTLSEGIVSAVRKDPAGIEFVQMSAPISPGSSGSPVVNRFGNVIGVATMYFTEGQSLNFAVSAHELSGVLKKTQLKPSTQSQKQ